MSDRDRLTERSGGAESTRRTQRTGIVAALTAAATAGIIGVVAATAHGTKRHPGPDPDPTRTACETFGAVAHRLHGAPTELARSGRLTRSLSRTWHSASLDVDAGIDAKVTPAVVGALAAVATEYENTRRVILQGTGTRATNRGPVIRQLIKITVVEQTAADACRAALG